MTTKTNNSTATITKIELSEAIFDSVGLNKREAKEILKKQHFKGLLLNANGTIIENSVADPADSNYLIVTYGFPEEKTTIRQTKGLVIYTNKFRQSYFFSKPDQYDIRRKYRYKSDKCDIEYYPSAKQLDLYLRKMYPN